MKNKKLEITAVDLAKLVKGELIGNPDKLITGICTADEPVKGAVAFTRETSAARIRELLDSGIAALMLLPKTERSGFRESDSLIIIKETGPSIAAINSFFHEKFALKAEISSKAEIHPSAKIGKNVFVGAYSVIGESVEIGDDTVIHPHVVIYRNVKIGARSVVHSFSTIRENCSIADECILQNGVVIGAEGFGYFLNEKFQLQPIPQIGNVVLERSVEVGAHSCIDRATIGTTRVGVNSKIDNLVQIGHNVTIGTNSVVCGHSGIAGSTTIGNYVTIGGHVGIADHLHIHDQVRIGGKAGVTSDLVEKGDYVGYPAIKASAWKRQMLLLQKIPEIVKKLKKLS